MADPSSFNLDVVARDGFAIVSHVLSADEVAITRDAAEIALSAGKSRAGLRDPLQVHPALRHAAQLPQIMSIARAIVGEDAFVTRAILFDKSPTANWDVVWHQDVTIAVDARHEVEGFGPWSVKDGIPHVQPPASVLDSMVTLRIHLDDSGPDNGPLLVVPGSHRRGIIDVKTLDVAACESSAVACVARAGDVVVMRPLTLHASRKSTSPSHRRVLHLEFAAPPLPSPLEWRIA